MRKLLFFILISLAGAGFEYAADISPNLAANHVGQTVTVCGVVSQVYVNKQSNVYLNFGGAYPHHLFSAVVSKRRTPALLAEGNQWLQDLDGKNVMVTGEIKLYGGKPQIIIRSRDNLKILEHAKVK